MPAKDAAVIEAMKELSGVYPRFGSRRIRIFLQRNGITVGKERCERLWAKAGLHGQVTSIFYYMALPQRIMVEGTIALVSSWLIEVVAAAAAIGGGGENNVIRWAMGGRPRSKLVTAS